MKQPKFSISNKTHTRNDLCKRTEARKRLRAKYEATKKVCEPALCEARGKSITHSPTMTSIHICCFCQKDAGRYGNNAHPICADKCCDDCNFRFVFPVRLSGITNEDEDWEAMMASIRKTVIEEHMDETVEESESESESEDDYSDDYSDDVEPGVPAGEEINYYSTVDAVLDELIGEI